MERSWVTAAAVAVAGVAGAFLLWPAPRPVPVVAFTPPPTVAGVVTIHVSGMVERPGLVALAEGARVADAIVAAGGALPGADLTAMNLAATVVDGQQLVIPDASAMPVTGSGGDGRVRINTADAVALEALPGVGPVLATRIVAHREAHGPFTVVEDLLDVPGIGESKLAAMRESVIVP